MGNLSANIVESVNFLFSQNTLCFPKTPKFPDRDLPWPFPLFSCAGVGWGWGWGGGVGSLFSLCRGGGGGEPSIAISSKCTFLFKVTQHATQWSYGSKHF